MTDYSTYTLPNGLRMIYQFVPSKVSYAGFAVNTGSRDEEKGEEGLAHFVEHLLFKGTLRRKSWHILNRMENVGGELNAYTAKEETVIYSIFLSEHFSRAVDLMSDLILHSQFPEAEVERETEVILDEINSYQDTPSELIYDEFENFLFGRHALGHNILGDRDTLLSFKSGDGRRFMNRHYTPSGMVFFIGGNFRSDVSYLFFPATWARLREEKSLCDVPRPVSMSHSIAACRSIRIRHMSWLGIGLMICSTVGARLCFC